MSTLSVEHLNDLKSQIHQWARELNFDGFGVCDGNLEQAGPALASWLASGWHGEMSFMARHTDKRSQPDRLVPGIHRVISVRLNYFPNQGTPPIDVLQDPTLGYIARYALGRDYHRLIRRKLQKLADRITESVGPFRYRAFADSAPVMEKPLAQAAGIGWIGKHTNLLNQHQGSWFFLGELYTDLPLPVDAPASNHCGSCTQCIDACPTGALDHPYQLDARLCIAYLTIEHKSAIPEPLRPLIGNRIFGCDDCQLVCPHNREAPVGAMDFSARHDLDASALLDLFQWSEIDFDHYTQGSPIRRLGYDRWLRNLAVALGNAPADRRTLEALQKRRIGASELVDEHIVWAIDQHEARLNSQT
ncbi:MAG: tRNA epoxyqueuosine(34) reductase QueG [Pseudomonadota bacterium]